MSSQTRTGKINTTILILINIQSYQRLRRLIHTVTDTVHNQHNDVTMSCQDSRSC